MPIRWPSHTQAAYAYPAQPSPNLHCHLLSLTYPHAHSRALACPRAHSLPAHARIARLRAHIRRGDVQLGGAQRHGGAGGAQGHDQMPARGRRVHQLRALRRHQRARPVRVLVRPPYPPYPRAVSVRRVRAPRIRAQYPCRIREHRIRAQYPRAVAMPYPCMCPY
eukprot:3940634-Rhodomonas_salina.1